MKKRYRIVYVGDDSCQHSTTVWAQSHAEAVAEVKKQGADFAISVRRLQSPLFTVAVILGIGVLLLVLILA